MSREVVLVYGPRPGRPGEGGRFMLEVCSYGHVPGEWITPLALPAEVGSSRSGDEGITGAEA
jgi:hypothetical protein